MSEKHNKVPTFFDLDDLGLGDDTSKEPDTGVTIKAIVEDSRSPGITKSLLAIVGYMRRVDKKHDKRFDALEKRDAKRLAWIAGAITATVFMASTMGIVFYELVIKPRLGAH